MSWWETAPPSQAEPESPRKFQKKPLCRDFQPGTIKKNSRKKHSSGFCRKVKKRNRRRKSSMLKKAGLVIGVLVFGSSAIWATPTINGTTGLIRIPTAESLQYKEFNIGFDYLGGNKPGSEQSFY